MMFSKKHSVTAVTAAFMALSLAPMAQAGDVHAPELPPFENDVPDITDIRGQTSGIPIPPPPVSFDPTCPSGFEVTYDTPTTFICGTTTEPQYVAGLAAVAQMKPCEYSNYWNVGPTVTISGPQDAPIVRWQCEHS